MKSLLGHVERAFFTSVIVVLGITGPHNTSDIVKAQAARQLPTRIQADDTPADITISGDLSRVIATGDFNGDGVDDFFAVYLERVASSIVFRKYGIIFGKRGQNRPVNIDLLKDEPDLSLTSERGSLTISTITKFGDLNDDGIDDIAMNQLLPGVGGAPASSAIKIFFGSSSLQPGVVDLDTLQPGLTVTPDGRAGVTVVTGVADINGDGATDLVLTERGGSINYIIAILLGPFPAGKTIDLNSQKADVIVTFSGVETVDRVLLGDVNGDGAADLLVRKTRTDSRIELYQASLNVVFGSEDLRSGAQISLSDGQGDAIITTGNYFSTITTGDINGDGFDDILFGTSVDVGEAPPPLFSFGNVSIILGSSSIEGVVSQPDVFIRDLSFPSSLASGEHVEQFDDGLGQSLETSDIDGDGVSDILIGAPGTWRKDTRFKNFSRVHVILGSTEIKKGTPVAIGREQQDITISSDKKRSSLGWLVGSGDFNGDGIRDILVGPELPHVFFGGPVRAPEITKAKYSKSSSRLLVFGTDLTGAARVEVNGVLVDREVTFDPDEGRLALRGLPSELNLKTGKNEVAVVRKGTRSNIVRLKL